MNQLNQISMGTPQTPAIRCVWMDAGVVNYKLCDRGYDCDRCPLDQALHRRPAERSAQVNSHYREIIFQNGR